MNELLIFLAGTLTGKVIEDSLPTLDVRKTFPYIKRGIQITWCTLLFLFLLLKAHLIINSKTPTEKQQQQAAVILILLFGMILTYMLVKHIEKQKSRKE